MITDTSNFVNQLYDYWFKIYKILAKEQGKTLQETYSEEESSAYKFRMKNFEDEVKDISKYSQTIIMPNIDESVDKSLIQNKGKALEDLIFELIDFLKEVQDKLLAKRQKNRS